MSIVTTEKRGSIMILTLNRPDSLNALGAEGDGLAIAAACSEIVADAEIRSRRYRGASYRE